MNARVADNQSETQNATEMRAVIQSTQKGTDRFLCVIWRKLPFRLVGKLFKDPHRTAHF